MLRGRPLATWSCTCCCDGESVDHLLLDCPLTHSLLTFMLQSFGIHWARISDGFVILLASVAWET